MLLFEIRDDFKMKICTANVKGYFWAEADYIEDIERIEEWFRNKNQ